MLLTFGYCANSKSGSKVVKTKVGFSGRSACGRCASHVSCQHPGQPLFSSFWQHLAFNFQMVRLWRRGWWMSQPMATARSALTLSRLATRCHSLHHRHFKAFETWKGKSFFSAVAPWLQRLQPARLPPRLPPGMACKVGNCCHLLLLILWFTPHLLLLRHSTCPVCRQTLAIEEEEEDEEGYDGGDESDDGPNEEG